MNRDQWEGKWKQLRGHIKKEWGKLTDDDLDRARGDMDILIGKIQEKYGLAREAIERRLEAMIRTRLVSTVAPTQLHPAAPTLGSGGGFLTKKRAERMCV